MGKSAYGNLGQRRGDGEDDDEDDEDDSDDDENNNDDDEDDSDDTIVIVIPEELESLPLKLYQFEEDISQKGLQLSFSWEQKNRNETLRQVGILMPYSLCYSEN